MGRVLGLSSQAKKDQVALLERLSKRSKHIIVTGYKGLDSVAMYSLRKNLKIDHVTCKVVKNRLMKISMHNAGYDNLSKTLNGPLSMVFVEDGDISNILKIVFKFKTENEKFSIISGYTDGQVLDSRELEKLSKLPEKSVLLGQFLYVLNAPVRNLAVVLKSSIQKLAVVLEQLKISKDKS